MACVAPSADGAVVSRFRVPRIIDLAQGRPLRAFLPTDFLKMTAPGYWEVTASGRRLSRQSVLDTLEERYAHPTEAVWEIGDFHCSEIAADNYLATYTLVQGERVTRRATIWR